MALSQEIGVPYAEALIALGQENHVLDDMANDIRLILAALQDTPDLALFLANPVVQVSVKKSALHQIFSATIHPLTLNFLQFITDRRRVMFLSAVCERFLALQRKLRGIALAEVTTVVPLTDDQQALVQERIQSLTKANQVELNLKHDPRVLGGMVIRVGSQVIDLSVRGQLRRLTLQLS